jgi:hypothetical protein
VISKLSYGRGEIQLIARQDGAQIQKKTIIGYAPDHWRRARP